MQLTIDKFGRILLPKIIRKSLGLEPGGELVVEIDEKLKVLSLTPVEVKEESEYIIYSEDGWPMMNFDFKLPDDFDTVAFMHETRDEYLDRKLGLN